LRRIRVSLPSIQKGAHKKTKKFLTGEKNAGSNNPPRVKIEDRRFAL